MKTVCPNVVLWPVLLNRKHPVNLIGFYTVYLREKQIENILTVRRYKNCTRTLCFSNIVLLVNFCKENPCVHSNSEEKSFEGRRHS